MKDFHARSSCRGHTQASPDVVDAKVLRGLERLRSKRQGQNTCASPTLTSTNKPKYRFLHGRKEDDKVRVFSTEQEVPPSSSYSLEVDKKQKHNSTSPNVAVPSHVDMPASEDRNILERFLITCASHCLTPLAPLFVKTKVDCATTVSTFYEQELERHPSIQKTASLCKSPSLLDEIQSAISSNQQSIEVDHRGRPRTGDETSTLSSIPNLLANLSWESIMSNEEKTKQEEVVIVHPLSIQRIAKEGRSPEKKESVKERNVQVFVAQEESKRDRGMKTTLERSPSMLDHLQDNLSMGKAIHYLLYPEHYTDMQRKDEVVVQEAPKPRRLARPEHEVVVQETPKPRRLALLRNFLRRVTCGCAGDAVDDSPTKEGPLLPKKQVNGNSSSRQQMPDECATDTESILTDEQGSLETYELTNDATLAGYSLADDTFEPMGKFLFAAQAMVCFADEGGARDINEILEEIIYVQKT